MTKDSLNKELITQIRQSTADLDKIADLIDQGADLSYVSEEKMPIHWAATNGHHDVIALLLNRGVNIDMLSKKMETPLVIAIEENKKDTVRFLIECGADVNLEYHKKRTAIKRAAEKGYDDIMQILLHHGANPNVSDFLGYSPLRIAILYDHNSTAQILMDHGADINQSNQNGYTALNQAIDKNSTEIALELIDRGADLHQFYQGLTPLMHAIKLGNRDIVKKMIEKGVDLAVTTKDSKTTPLMIAAKKGNDDILALLIQHEVNIDATDIDDNSALIFAVDNNHLSTVKHLITQGADLNLVNKTGKNALITAIDNNYTDIAIELIEHHADLNQHRGLRSAILKGNKTVIEKMIEYGVNLDVTIDSQDLTPVALAAKSAQTEILELFIKNGCDINKTTNLGKTPLMLALNCDKWMSNRPHLLAAAQILIDQGADVNVMDKSSNTAFSIAIDKSHDDMALQLIDRIVDADIDQFFGQYNAITLATLENKLTITKKLLEKGANTETKSVFSGRTPLLTAVVNNNKEMVELLLAHQADPHVCDRDGTTSLMQATLKRNHDIAQLLIDHGVDVHAMNNKGNIALSYAIDNLDVRLVDLLLDKMDDIDHYYHDKTPLMWAIESGGYLAMIEVFMTQGADVNLGHNKDGTTPLMMAAQNGYVELIQLLVKYGATIDQGDKDGQTALMFSARYGHTQAAKTLIDLGAHIDAQDIDHETALTKAAKKGHLETLKLLMKNGANLFVEDRNGFNIAMRADYHHHKHIVDFLALQGVEVDVEGYKNSDIGLIYAVFIGNKEAVAQLIAADTIDMNQVDHINGSTAIMFAAQQGNVEIVDMLMAAHCDISIANKDNKTAFDYAKTATLKSKLKFAQNNDASRNVSQIDVTIEDAIEQDVVQRKMQRINARNIRKELFKNQSQAQPIKPKDDSKEDEHFEKFKQEAWDDQIILRQDLLNILYRYGIGVTQDIAQADKWRDRAQDLGLPPDDDVTEYFDHLFSEYRDSDKIAILEQAVQRDQHKIAAYYLAYLYDKGQVVMEDEAKARELYILSANQGYAKSQNNLAMMHEKGNVKDMDKALMLYQLAAQQNYVPAQLNLAFYYEEKDSDKSIKYYQLAAQAGNTLAQNNLAFIYQNGQGVEKDMDKAIALYQMAADKGNHIAQKNLGICYEQGKGVEKDYNKALELFKLAGDKGKYLLESLLDSMLEDEIKEAEEKSDKHHKESRVTKIGRTAVAKEKNDEMRQEAQNNNPSQHNADGTKVSFADNPNSEIQTQSWKQLTRANHAKKTR